MKAILLIFIAFTCGEFRPCLANDGAAGLMGGDLHFKNLKGVRMLEEHLFLSFNEVRVRYIFKNQTSKNIKTLISFPVKIDLDGGDLAYDTQSKNPLKFTVSVNGTRKKFKTRTQKAEYEKTLHHYWTQNFPANRKITIEHSYKPIFDTSVLYGIAGTEEFTAKDWENYFGKSLSEDYCATRKQIKQVKKKGLLFKKLSYILTTAATWDGSIGEFNLEIDKGSNPFIFLCTGLDLQKRAGTKIFHASKKNFVPKKDLKIAFVGKFDL